VEIVPQSVSPSYCPFPPMLALPAPIPIAGLLPARVPSSLPPIAVFKARRESALDRQRAIWAAQDAEIELFLEGARQRLAAVYAEIRQDAANRSARSFIWEIAS